MARNDHNDRAAGVPQNARRFALKPPLDLAPGALPALAHRLLQLIPALLELAAHAGGPVAGLPGAPAAAQVALGFIPRPGSVARVARLLPAVAVAVADIVPGGVG